MTLATASRPGSGRRKAAIALVALGTERAAGLLQALDEEDVRALVAEIAALGPVTPDEVRATLTELHSSLSSIGTLPAPGARYARDLLVRALGEDNGARLAEVLDTPAPFAWLAEADPDQAAAALASEPAAAVALALVHLPPQPAARLLVRLPDVLRREVATRVAALQTVHPDTVAEVEAALRHRVEQLLVSEVAAVQGPAALAEILTFTSRNDERSMLQTIAAADPELAEAVRAALFTFDDVAQLEPRALQTLLKAVDARELATALKNADDTALDRVLANLSERAREGLLEEIDLLSSVRAGDIAAARQNIVATARRLEEEGAITISRPDDGEA